MNVSTSLSLPIEMIAKLESLSKETGIRKTKMTQKLIRIGLLHFEAAEKEEQDGEI